MTTGKNLTPTSAKPATIHVPLATEDVDAATLEVPAQSLYNYAKWLEDGNITVKSGIVLTALTGGAIEVDAGASLVANGAAEFHGTGASATSIDEASSILVRDLTVNTTLSLPSPAVATFQGGTMFARFGRARTRSLVTLPDSTPQTIDTTQGDEFVLPNSPTAGPPIVIYLRDTSPIPLAQERITLIVRKTGVLATPGVKYEIRRETSTALIASFSYATTGTTVSICADFVLDGAVWQLSRNSGHAFDPASIAYGVIPG